MSRSRAATVCLSLMAATVTVALAGPVAHAATVHLEVLPAPGGPVAKLVYRAAPGEANWIAVCAAVGSGPCVTPVPGRPSAYEVTRAREPGPPTVLGPGCEPSNDPLGVARCPLPAGTRPTGPLIELGDRQDFVDLVPTAAFRTGTVLRGGSGSDYLFANSGLSDGGSGNDLLQGTNYVGPVGWSRHLKGGPGADLITGGSGPDVIEPGPGRDHVHAGAGADRIYARDGQFDDIRCGAGFDRLSIDSIDLAVGTACDRIRRRGPPRAIPFDPDPGEAPDLPLGVRVACPTDMRGKCRATVIFTIRSGRKVGKTRMRLRPGQIGWASTSAAPLDREVWATVLTLRRHRRPLRAKIAAGSWTEATPHPTLGTAIQRLGTGRDQLRACLARAHGTPRLTLTRSRRLRVRPLASSH